MAEIAARPAPVLAQRAFPFRMRWEIILLSLPALILVVGLFLLPFIFGIDLSLRSGARGEGPQSLANYQNFFNDPSQLDTIWSTFQAALPVSLVSAAVPLPPPYFTPP